MKNSPLFGALISLGLLAAAPVGAAVITSTLGNDSPGFNDGDTPNIIQLIGAQGGQPAPFDKGYGNDVLLGTDFAGSWSHGYGAVADPIVSASLTFGIADHDSAATGSQVATFSLDGNDFAATLDAMFEAVGEGGDGQYDVYSIDLSGMLGDLADGTLNAALELQGPGLVTPLFPLPGPNPPQDSIGNGAHLIFATLEITTQDDPNGQVPLPSSLALSLLGLGVWRARLRRAKD